MALIHRIANAYQQGPRLEITPEIRDHATKWVLKQAHSLIGQGFYPVYVDRDVPLTEALAAFDSGSDVPVSTLGTASPLFSPTINCLFRFIHDHAHWVTYCDDSWEGELDVALHHVTRTDDPLMQTILASEVAGQAAVAITTGTFPEQYISTTVLALI